MNGAALELPESELLRPRPPGGLGYGALLALLMHVLLVLALAAALGWRSQTPQTFAAELWAAVPQVAARKAVEPEPTPPRPAPQPQPTPPAPPPRPPEPSQAEREAQIAVEQAKKAALEQAEREKAEREKARREQAEREKAERLKAEREKAEREKAQREKAEREAKAQAEAREREKAERERKAEEARLAQQRKQNLERMMGQVDATGTPGSTGSAARDAAPSATYAGRLIARIKPNILLTEVLPGKPSADVEVRASPAGTILSRRLVKSSGNKEWDDAVLRAIDRTGELPRDVDGRVPAVIVITFTP